nr:zinc-binding dehydrogenase [Akkermansiaceae bacterium]
MSEQSIQTALAAVFTSPGVPISLERVPLPEPGEGEVLVRVRACTLCGSDLHTYRGDRVTPTPTILGHEILGQIEARGDGRPPADHEGRPLEVGDRITWSIAASCGHCFFCDHEIPQKCESLFKYGHHKMEAPHLLGGGLAEYCHLARGTAMVRVPESLSDRVACPANCATATVVAALRVGIEGRSTGTALVQGAGMLGLTACAMLRARGVGTVIAADLDPARLSLATEFGATHTVEAGGTEALEAVVREVTAGRGVDLALEMSGSPLAVADGLAALRVGGRQVLVGSVFPTDPVSIEPEMIVRNLKSIHGVHNYVPGDLVEAVAFLERHHEE